MTSYLVRQGLKYGDRRNVLNHVYKDSRRKSHKKSVKWNRTEITSPRANSSGKSPRQMILSICYKSCTLGLQRVQEIIKLCLWIFKEGIISIQKGLADRSCDKHLNSSATIGATTKPQNKLVVDSEKEPWSTALCLVEERSSQGTGHVRWNKSSFLPPVT